jgi:heterotetrameric sarcosine oxidase gamma subunit
MLTTASDLPYSSPLAGLADGPVGSEAAQLADWSGRLVLDVRGRDSLVALRDVFATVPEAVGEVAHLEHGILARLRADRWIYMALSASGEARSVGAPSLIDATHGYGILYLRGARAPAVLAQLCGLDFDDRVFPDRRAAQTSLAKVPALVVRLDDGARAYLILVERSLAAYVWTITSEVVRGVDQFAP